MPALLAWLARFGAGGGRAIWGLLSSSKFQAGAFLSWLAFDGDEDSTSGTAGAVVGFAVCLLLIAAWLVYHGVKRVAKSV